MEGVCPYWTVSDLQPLPGNLTQCGLPVCLQLPGVFSGSALVPTPLPLQPLSLVVFRAPWFCTAQAEPLSHHESAFCPRTYSSRARPCPSSASVTDVQFCEPTDMSAVMGHFSVALLTRPFPSHQVLTGANHGFHDKGNIPSLLSHVLLMCLKCASISSFF